jgi:hypothetical protein
VHESSSFKNLGGLLAGLSFERRQYPWGFNQWIELPQPNRK